MIDLSQMRAVRVTPWNATVRCEGGAQIGDLDRETQAFGLGGAAGRGVRDRRRRIDARRWHGLDAPQARAELRQPDLGRRGARRRPARARASDENADLFWALRGGGWDLGVVVSFELQAYPLGPEVFMTFVTYPRAEGTAVLRGFRDAYAAAPAGAAPLAVCWTFPDADAFPRELWGQPFVAVIGPYAGPVDEGKRAMQPFRSLGTVLTDRSGAHALADCAALLRRGLPERAALLLEVDVPARARATTASTPLLALARRAPVAASQHRHLAARRRDRRGGAAAVAARQPRGAVHDRHREQLGRSGGRRAKRRLWRATRSPGCSRSRPAAPT